MEKKVYVLLAVICFFSLVMFPREASAWWNSNYNYRYLVNCSGMDNNMPLVVNGSSGILINGSSQVIWTLCTTGNLSVYFNSLTNYTVANETSQIPFEVEYGNGTDLNRTKIWTGYWAVWHFGGNSTSSFSLDSSNWSRHLDFITPNIIQFNKNPRPGFIGSNYQFMNVSDARMRTTSTNGLPSSSGNVSIIVFLNYTVSSAGQNPFLVNFGTTAAEQALTFMVSTQTTYNNVLGVYPGSGAWVRGNKTITNQTPQMVAMTVKRTAINTSVNGSLDKSQAITAPGSLAKVISLGGFYSNVEPLVQMWGILDEVRIYGGNLSVNYYNKVYKNINFNNGFGNSLEMEVFGGVNVTSSNTSCVYSGSGDWLINASDHCNLTSTNLFRNNVYINGININECCTTGIRNVYNYSLFSSKYVYGVG